MLSMQTKTISPVADNILTVSVHCMDDLMVLNTNSSCSVSSYSYCCFYSMWLDLVRLGKYTT